MAGGSHTNFDEHAFTVGALSGAGIIAGALGAGIANYRAAQQRRFAYWNAVTLRAALDLSEQLRTREHASLRSKAAIITAQRVTIARLESQLAIAQARSRRRS
jgi:uncharacterized protein HemX